MGYVCLHDIFDWRSERCFALQHDIPRIVSLRYDTNQFSIVHDKQRADVFVSHFCKWHRVPLCSDQWSTGTGPFVQEDVLWSWRASLLLAFRGVPRTLLRPGWSRFEFDDPSGDDQSSKKTGLQYLDRHKNWNCAKPID